MTFRPFLDLTHRERMCRFRELAKISLRLREGKRQNVLLAIPCQFDQSCRKALKCYIKHIAHIRSIQPHLLRPFFFR